MTMNKTFALLATASLLGACSSVVAEQAVPTFENPEMQALFEASKPMTGDHLFAVFHSRTWKWSAGGGFFEPNSQQFSAWSREGGKATIGEGRWFTVTSKGKLCFNAKWTAIDGSGSAVTCFLHRIVGNTIFQKKAPDGEWYVFKHAKRTKGDEFLKLLKGNYAYHPSRKIKAQMEADKAQ